MRVDVDKELGRPDNSVVARSLGHSPNPGHEGRDHCAIYGCRLGRMRSLLADLPYNGTATRYKRVIRCTSLPVKYSVYSPFRAQLRLHSLAKLRGTRKQYRTAKDVCGPFSGLWLLNMVQTKRRSVKNRPWMYSLPFAIHTKTASLFAIQSSKEFQTTTR